jgi:hypothetical protein
VRVMYNREFKERFLEESDIEPSTQKTYRFVLEKAEATELNLGKDIYAFTPYECDVLINSFSRRSTQMVSVIISVLKRYMDFCISNNQVEKDYFNYFSTISGQPDFKKYVDKTALENKFITFDGLLEIQKILRNAQDMVQVELLFCGVNGKEGEELLNLKVKDVIAEKRTNINGVVKIESAKIILPNREIPITNRTHGIIVDAVDQTEYYKGNGECISDVKNETMPINRTEYVLRAGGSTKSGKLTYPTLQMRINRIKEFFGNPYLTLTSIWHSGMLYQLSQIKETKGDVTKEDYQKINKLFGYGENYWYQSKVRFSPFL